MNKILFKRTLREIKDNAFRYAALCLLVFATMFLVVATLGSAESCIKTVTDTVRETNLEDGEFGTFVALSDSEIESITSKGVDIEEMNYAEYELSDSSVLRVMKAREHINTLHMISGSRAEGVSELVLEKTYARAHGLEPGSTIEVGGKTLTVSGIAVTEDYDMCVRQITDTATDAELFGTAFVTPELYSELLSDGNALQSESFRYAYKLNGAMTDDELKELLSGFEVNIDAVQDKYFKEMVNKAVEDKEKAENAINEFNDAAQELDETLGKMRDGANSLNDGIQASAGGLNKISDSAWQIANAPSQIISALDQIDSSMGSLQTGAQQLAATTGSLPSTGGSTDAVLAQVKTGASSLSSGLSTLHGGVGNLRSGVAQMKGKLTNFAGTLSSMGTQFSPVSEGSSTLADSAQELKKAGEDLVVAAAELKSEADALFEKYFTVEISKLTDFITADNNPRIMASVEDSSSDLSMGILIGIIVLVVIVYVISVFVAHSIEQEASVIGTLYALGLSPRKLRNHYVVLPVVICLVGGIAGTVAGFSEFGFSLMGGGAARYFSMPDLVTYYAPYILLYGLFMPPFVAWLVNSLVLRKKLNKTALSLMRRQTDEEVPTGRTPKTKNFVRLFRRRQLAREKRSTLAIVGGVFISLMVLALGFNTLYFCDNLKMNTLRDTSFDRMYLYKYPDEQLPAGGHGALIMSLSHTAGGQSTDVTIIGLDKDNPFFPEIASKRMDTLSISSAAATKFNLKDGDEFTLADTVNERIYGFRVEETVEYGSGLYVFMDIKSMRELFGHDEDYFNAVFADRALDIDAGRLYSVTTRQDIVNSAAVFSGLMESSCTVMIIVSIIVFIVVLYQMLRVMIDRSATPIALMKIFGYNNSLVRKLYLDGNFVIVLVVAPLLILLSKWAMDAIFPSMLISACGNDFTWPLWLYFAIYGGVIVLYLVIRQLLMRNLNRITPALVLKDRE